MVFLVTILISIPTCYLLLAVIFTMTSVNNKFTQPENGIEIFVHSNGVHADIAVPVRTLMGDWMYNFDLTQFAGVNSTFQYISFGWGDKEFYLNTPKWKDFKISSAFKAVFLPTPTVMHVSFIRSQHIISNSSKRILVKKVQYLQLIDYIDSSFQKDERKNYKIIPYVNYGIYDRFFEANGKYHLAFTCNNWTNKALKEIGVKTAFWAPIDKCVLYHLD